MLIETESPKKEKRKRKSEGNDEGPRKKKNKQQEQLAFVPQRHMSDVAYVNGIDGSQNRTKKKPKSKDEATSKPRFPADGSLASGENVDNKNERLTSEKKKRKRETPDQEAPSSDPQIRNKSNVGVLKSNQQPTETKQKRRKEMNSTSIPEKNHILQADVHREEKQKKKKKKKRKNSPLALNSQDVNSIGNKNHFQSEELRNKKSIGSEVETSGSHSQSVCEFLVHRSDDPERYLAEAKVQIETHEKTMQSTGWPDKLAKQHPSSIQTMTVSLRVPIPPIGQAIPLASVCADTLSPMILRWDPDLKGVVLAYRNPKLVNSPRNLDNGGEVPLAQTIDEYAAPFVWVQADFMVFTPRRGLWLDGYISLQNESYIGMVIFNLFNATIERKRLPQDWDWIEDEQDQVDVEPAAVDGVVEYETGGKRRKFMHSLGHFEDGHGNVINGWVRFRVWDFEPAFSEKDERHFLTIEGTLLTDDEEKSLEEQERRNQQRTKSTRVPVTPRRSALRSGPSLSQ